MRIHRIAAAASIAPAPAMAAANGLTLSADLPLRRDTDREGIPATSAGTVAFLLVVLVLAVAFAWHRQRRGNGKWDWRRALRLPAGETRLRVLASTRLDARASVHVLEWEGSHLLVARGEQAITLLAQRRALAAAEDELVEQPGP